MTLQPIKNTHSGYQLWSDVNAALMTLPAIFKTNINISGIQAPDLFALNSLLSVSVETEVVNTLNKLKPEWGSHKLYPFHSFIRQSQVFPDVIFARRIPNTNQIDTSSIVMGVELKSWYVLSKEEEPSFRYKITAAACNDLDLLVVIPWHLSEVISGAPLTLTPYIESAKFVAEVRNNHWVKTHDDIRVPAGVGIYPDMKTECSDNALRDKGNNFGRIARTGIMDSYVRDMLSEPLLGIPAKNWISFLKEAKDTMNVQRVANTNMIQGLFDFEECADAAI
jgi:hypothetical protein